MSTKVTIVIPTWQRHELLLECLNNIETQTYPHKEILIVSDGKDELLRSQFKFGSTPGRPDGWKNMKVGLITLGQNWSGLMPRSFGIAPLLVGYLCAGSDYIMPWCDDERALVPDHIERMVKILDTYDHVDFVYPRVKIWRNGDPDGPETAIIGVCPPIENQITHYMFRASNLWRFGMPDWETHPVDWALIKKWMDNGAQGTMLNAVTFEHRLDQ